MDQLEIAHLTLRYAALRVMDPGRVSRLAASIAREGQRAPVLVVGDVLVDGFHRVEALRTLARDLVSAVALQVSEAEGLVLARRLETGRRKTALEEGWLLAELALTHGRSQLALAAEMRRPRSWVSERLGLVRVLPESVQEAVRAAKIPMHAAMKVLVPMARQDAKACETLIRSLVEPATTRQFQRLYSAWRQADDEGRRRIVEHPDLLLKAEEAVSPPVALEAEEKLALDLEGIAGLCRRARKAVREGAFTRGNLVRQTWTQASEAFQALEGEVRRAGP